MYPVTLQTVSAARDREMREQAAAWRRAREARGTAHARSSKFPFALIAWSLAWHKPLHGPAAA